MKIYTKKGDAGCTSLYDGTTSKKSDEIFDVLGTSDELSSNIGMLIALIHKSTVDTKEKPLINYLRNIQGNLQHINSELATPNIEKRNKLVKIDEFDVQDLEDNIDLLESYNDKLTTFILPGVSVEDSQAHICRTLTRRLERDLYKINNDSKYLMSYINRLSDFFFVLARFLCKKLNLIECAI